MNLFDWERTLRAGMLVLSVATLTVSSPLHAQTSTGEMTISVKDASGAVIPAAQVKITGTETKALVRSVHTDANGYVDVPLLPPGTYTATVTAPGFKTYVRSGLLVSVGQVVALDVQAEVGDLSESVMVSGEAPLVETKSETVAQVVSGKQVTELPLNGRNYLSAANLVPGVVPTRAGRDNSFNSFGNSGLQNAFLLDGVRNVTYIRGLPNGSRDAVRPPLDAIQEFTVQTSNFSAEFGASAGAVVNVITKSGTDTVHGSVYEFIENSAVNASEYFARTKPLVVQNQYGASLGGPLFRKHAWLFGAYEGLHYRTETSQTAQVPTLLERQGNFSATLNSAGAVSRVFDPDTTAGTGTTATRTQFAGNIIPAARIRDVGRRLANSYPLPNAGSNTYRRNLPTNRDYKNGVARLDYQISSRDNLFARYSRDNRDTAVQQIFQVPVDNDGFQTLSSTGVGAGYIRIFSSTLVNEARFGYTAVSIVQQGSAPRDEIIPGSLDPAVLTGTPIFNVSNFGTLGAQGYGNSPADKTASVWIGSDNVSKTLGKHSLKFGGEVQFIRPQTMATSNGRATFGFTGVFSQNPSSRATTGSPIADLLLGDANSLVTGTITQSTERGWFLGGYLSDQWSATDALTLNLGLRYEYASPYSERDNRLGNFILDPADPLYGKLILAGDPRLPRAGIYGDRNNLAPRVGLGYRVPHVKDMTIRSAFGIFYAQDPGTGVANRLVNNPPFFGFGGQNISSNQLQPSTGFVLTPGATISRPAAVSPSAFVLVPTATSGLVAWKPHIQTGYIEEWSLSVQKQIPYGILVETTYVGNHGLHLLGFGQGNQPRVLNSTTVNSRRPLAAFTIAPVTYVQDRNASNYNGLTAKLEKRYNHGVSFLTSLTWGHAFDIQNQAGDLCDGCDVGDTIQDNYDYNANYARSDNDVRLRYVLSGTAELPFGKGQPFLNSGVASVIAGGWVLAPIFQYQTGSYSTPSLGFDAANAGTVTRPNRLCNGNIGGGTLQRYFDTSCFVAPPSYTFGNTGRNIIEGPPRNELDLMAQRQFQIERLHSAVVHLRFEAFNVLNHPQFGQPNVQVGNTLYGTINTATLARQLQAAIRITF